MYKDTITLFNFHKATGMWYPTVIYGADIGANSASSSTKSGKNNADAVEIILHCKADKSIISASGEEKSFLDAKAYEKCENPAVHITFSPECDFIYAGEWQGGKSLLENDYEAGFYHAMNEEHDGVYMISSAEFFGLLPHFEIGGK